MNHVDKIAYEYAKEHGDVGFDYEKVYDAVKYGYNRALEDAWKPNEEQMGALNYAYCELFKREDVGHNILGPLQKLCDELKKL